MLGPLIATGKDDAAVSAEREKQRQLLGFLYSTPAYWPSLELFGWQDKGQQLLDMTRNGSWHDMPAIINDDMLAEFVPSGRYDEIVALLRERYEGLAGRISFPMPGNPADDEFAAKAIAGLKH
jgi:hypothetical protein